MRKSKLFYILLCVVMVGMIGCTGEDEWDHACSVICKYEVEYLDEYDSHGLCMSTCNLLFDFCRNPNYTIRICEEDEMCWDPEDCTAYVEDTCQELLDIVAEVEEVEIVDGDCSAIIDVLTLDELDEYYADEYICY